VRSRTRSDRAALAAVLDVVCVIAFVVAGRRSHDEGSGIGGVLEVAAPFLIALAAGWFALRIWQRPLALAPAAGLWVITVALGLVLRRFVFDRGTAASFVIVATLVLGALLFGWRLVARRR
jgi:Protein of unknown function (DUF3054)